MAHAAVGSCLVGLRSAGNQCNLALSRSEFIYLRVALLRRRLRGDWSCAGSAVPSLKRASLA